METCRVIFVAKHDELALCRKEKGHNGGHVGDPIHSEDIIAENARLREALEEILDAEKPRSTIWHGTLFDCPASDGITPCPGHKLPETGYAKIARAALEQKP